MEDKKSNNISNFFTKATENFVFIAMLLMVLLVFINVVGRFVFKMGITESKEIAKILFVWLSFVGAILCFKDNSHIIVDIVLTFLPDGPKKVVNIISNIFVGLILAYTFYHSIGFIVINKGLAMPLTKIPVMVVQSIVPIAMAVMFIMNIWKLIKIVKR